MDGNWEDLDDNISASVGGGVPIAGHKMITSNWQPPGSPNFPRSPEGLYNNPVDPIFDSVLQELDDTILFGISEPVVGLVKSNIVGDDNGRTMASRGSDTRPMELKVFENNEVGRPDSIFASVLQISHGGEASSMASSREAESSPVLTCETAKANISLLGCPLGQEGLQISSPRIPGNKRRKNQAKKVVCIPAPVADSGRPSGEAVPSDLWAWRKYGQKPIKGSPYPRGYYRCSSSKGCPARKQVERSGSDPNMLVITYTSEHDHPWPSQRNALAGSTRSQPSKNDPSAPMKSSPPCRQLPPAMVKEEQMEAAGTTVSSAAPPVKEEALEVEMATTMCVDGDHHELEDDFFAELGELESGLMGGLVFSKEFLEGKPDGGKENDAMDPFSSFDWAGKSFGQGRK